MLVICVQHLIVEMPYQFFISHCELPVAALPILPTDHEPHTCHPEQREGSAFTAVKKQILHCVQDDMLKVTIPVGFMERSETTKQSRFLPTIKYEIASSQKALLAMTACVVSYLLFLSARQIAVLRFPEPIVLHWHASLPGVVSMSPVAALNKPHDRAEYRAA